MEIPLFLDTDNLHEKPKYVRFIYWVLKIKELDFDLLCDCGDKLSYSPLQNLKLVFVYDQLILVGLKDNNKNYHFTNAGKFERLFKIIDEYNTKMKYPYLMIDAQYTTCPFGKLQFNIPPGENTIRGTIFRYKPMQFQLSNLLYPDEIYGWDNYPALSLTYAEQESTSYKMYLENNRWAI